jgi:quinol monooxygenase YgiN
MIVKLVRYRIHRSDAPVVEAAVRDFVSAVAEHERQTTYNTYRATNGVSYVHLMTFPDEGAEQRHRGAAYTKAFVDRLYPLCDAGPTFSDLEPLASAGV